MRYRRNSLTGPSTPSGHSNNYVFRSKTAAGQSQLALLLTAKATGRGVIVFGTDACTIDGATEDMTAVIIK